MNNQTSLVTRSRVSFVAAVILILGFVCIVGVDVATAQVQGFPNTPDLQITKHTLRKKAAPDECWAYLSMPSPLPMFSDPTDCGRYATTPPAKPKVNQSYIWGVVESGENLWFGTFANGNCVTQAGSTPNQPGNPNGAPTAYVTDAWVCEYYDSPYFPGLYPDARIGDARAPRAYRYNRTTQTLDDMTPRYDNFEHSILNPEGIMNLFAQMRGIRAAAAYNNVIILAGPNLGLNRGIGFFGWDATTGEFLGGYSVLGYNNIRQFLNLNGILYTAVGTNDTAGKVTGGAVLRVNPTRVPKEQCTFNPANPAVACFLLNGGTPQAPTPPTVVGSLSSVAGSIAAHNGRIFTVTWNSTDLPNALATLYMSPSIPEGGLTNSNAGQWTSLWTAADYEPDPQIVKSYAGGAIASFDGYLWWGTLHIPMAPFQYLTQAYPPTSQEETVRNLIGTFRSTIFLRGKDLDTNPKIEVLYGNEKLPVWTPPPAPGQPGTWTLVQNKTGKKSLWGSGGFGNMWNTYTWAARVWNNRLWVGTMDWGFAAQQGVAMMSGDGSSFPPNLFDPTTFGADLFYFTSGDKPGFPESTNGVDNPTTYGIRNQVASANGNLFLGMANPMNLATDPADPHGFGGRGGWELIELSPSTSLNTPTGANVPVNLPSGISITFCNVNAAGSTYGKIVTNPFRPLEAFPPLLSPYDLDGPELPLGIADEPTNFAMLWSSASWGQGCGLGPLANVTVPYSPGTVAPRLLQLNWDGTEYRWTNITTSVDTAGLKVSGAITRDYIGVLAIASANPPSVSAAISNSGIDSTTGAYFVDLTISNTGVVRANHVTISQLSFATLNGPGTVSYNTAVGPPLPLSVGDLARGESKVVRLYLKSTTSFGWPGVIRFSITETLNMTDGIGSSYTTTQVQNLAPAR